MLRQVFLSVIRAKRSFAKLTIFAVRNLLFPIAPEERPNLAQRLGAG